jgi:hypothetical protein
VEKSVRLIGSYAEHPTTTAEECFDSCDADSKCAAASFTTLPEQKKKLASLCLFYKFGFIRTPGANDAWTSFIKPEVAAELVGLKTLTKRFRDVKLGTQFVNHTHYYENVDTLTPSSCFSRCKESELCASASFTVDVVFVHNCFLYKKSSVELTDVIPDSYWFSYMKVSAIDK